MSNPRRALCLVLVVASACTRGADLAGPEERLRQLIDRAAPPERVSFEHAAGGTRVNDCFRPNRRFGGQVDYEREVLVITKDSTTLAVVTPKISFLHRSLFRDGTVATTWLRVHATASADRRAAIRAALGVDLAGYVLAGGLPPSGNDTARAVVDVATDIETLTDETAGARRTSGFRIQVPASAFENVTSSTSAPAPEAGDAVVDLWVDEEGNVRRVIVTPGMSPGGDEGEPGWIVDYDDPSTTLEVPDTSDATDVEALDPGAIGAAPLPSVCEVPI